jgi:hypothetical protein
MAHRERRGGWMTFSRWGMSRVHGRICDRLSSGRRRRPPASAKPVASDATCRAGQWVSCIGAAPKGELVDHTLQARTGSRLAKRQMKHAVTSKQSNDHTDATRGSIYDPSGSQEPGVPRGRHQRRMNPESDQNASPARAPYLPYGDRPPMRTIPSFQFSGWGPKRSPPKISPYDLRFVRFWERSASRRTAYHFAVGGGSLGSGTVVPPGGARALPRRQMAERKVAASLVGSALAKLHSARP